MLTWINDTLFSIAILFYRVVLSLGIITHGWDKLTNFQAMSAVFPDPIGLGGQLSLILVIFAEFFCALGVLFGCLTRLALIPLIIAMGVAAFVQHAADPFSAKELALLYFSGFILLILTGPGFFSFDAMIRPILAKWKKNRSTDGGNQ